MAATKCLRVRVRAFDAFEAFRKGLERELLERAGVAVHVRQGDALLTLLRMAAARAAPGSVREDVREGLREAVRVGAGATFLTFLLLIFMWRLSFTGTWTGLSGWTIWTRICPRDHRITRGSGRTASRCS